MKFEAEGREFANFLLFSIVPGRFWDLILLEHLEFKLEKLIGI